jgi:peptidoglycan/LPS O-acetylase OafA/YrhL
VAAVVDFIERRFWRLFPPFWFSLPLGILSVWVIWGKAPSLSMLLANSTMLPTLWNEPFAMGHYWTLEVELAFYFLCGLLYALFGRISLILSIVCLVLAFVAKRERLLAGTPDHWPFAALDLAIMFWGCSCRLVFDGALPARLGRYRRALGYVVIAAGAAVVLWDPLSLLRIGYERDLLGHRRLGWGYSLGVILFCVWVLLAKIRVRLLEWMGKGTYSIYLLHPVAFYIAYKIVLHPSLVAFTGLHLGVYIAGLTPVCVAVGMLGYYLIERPADIFRRLLRQPAAPKREDTQPPPSARVARSKRFSSTPHVSHAHTIRGSSRPGARRKNRSPRGLGATRSSS